jgi:cbb3-type cytochrome oxidase subunit 3
MQSLSEIYFITAMMILILIGCVIAVVAFFRTYKREQLEREKEARKIKQLRKAKEKTE